MRNLRAYLALGLTLTFISSSTVSAKESAPLPDTAFDGGAVSAETLGRGNTTASNRGTPASGSENPAALDLPGESGSWYSTALVGTSSRLPEDVVEDADPLDGKVLQYFSFAGEKGVIFFEPVGRTRRTEILDASTGQEREIDFSANAIGFAGADKMKDGSIGVSIAYLYSSTFVEERTGTTITSSEHDTGNGLRLAIGARYPKGPVMFGFAVQNAPGFIWGKEFKRMQLPFKVKFGSTYRISNKSLFSAEVEKRYYNEGSNSESYIYLGNETFFGDFVVLRAGAFGTSLDRSEDRHLTAGITLISKAKTAVSYAYESFEIDTEKVSRSIISVSAPFAGGE
jgi:hypothetical protein